MMSRRNAFLDPDIKNKPQMQGSVLDREDLTTKKPKKWRGFSRVGAQRCAVHGLFGSTTIGDDKRQLVAMPETQSSDKYVEEFLGSKGKILPM
jgi:hypothetical protein